MAKIDYTIFLLLLYGAYKGYKRGFIVEIVSIFAFIVSVIIAFKFMGFSASFLTKYIDNPVTSSLLPYIGFAVLFYPIVFFINKIGWLLRSSTKASILGNLDTMIGACVGMLTWAVGVSVVFWLISGIGIKIEDKIKHNSVLYPIIKPIAPTLIGKSTAFVNETDLLQKIKNND